MSLRVVGRALGTEGEVRTKVVLALCCGWCMLTIRVCVLVSQLAALFHKAKICLQGWLCSEVTGSFAAYRDGRIVPSKPQFHCRHVVKHQVLNLDLLSL